MNDPMIMDESFYQALQARLAEFIRSTIPTMRQVAQESPLRAVCVEYDEQCTLNVRVESLEQWRQRDEVDVHYSVSVPGERWPRHLSKGDVIRAIADRTFDASYRVTPGALRDYSLKDMFPTHFGLDQTPVEDLNWRYSNGDIFVVNDVLPEELYNMLDQYWTRYDEVVPVDDEDEESQDEGEEFTFIEIHHDGAFVHAVREALLQTKPHIEQLPLTADFIAYVVFHESFFTPDCVVFGTLTQRNGA